MELELTSDQELLRDTTRKFLTATVPLTQVRALADNPAGFERGWWRKGAELGWTSLLVDEQRGGGSVSGEGLSDLALVAEEMGVMVSPGPLIATNVVAQTLSRDSEAMINARIAQIDHLLSIQLNEVLHNPAFQKLEASWRGLPGRRICRRYIGGDGFDGLGLDGGWRWHQVQGGTSRYFLSRRYWSVLLIQSARGGLKMSRSTVSSTASALCGMFGGMVSTSPARTTISRPSIQNFSAPSRM